MARDMRVETDLATRLKASDGSIVTVYIETPDSPSGLALVSLARQADDAFTLIVTGDEARLLDNLLDLLNAANS